MKPSMILGLLLFMCVRISAQEEKIDARLAETIALADEKEFINVIIELKEQARFEAENLDRTTVLTQLQQIASSSQLPVRQLLNERLSTSNVEAFEAYYIINGLWVRCQKAVIEELSRMPQVARLYLDEAILINDTSSSVETKSTNQSTPVKISTGQLLVESHKDWR